MAVLLALLASCGGGGAPFNPDQNQQDNNPPQNIPPQDDPPAGDGIWLVDIYNQLPPEGSANRAFQNASALATAEQILAILNQERATEGLPPLKWDPHLERVAQAHALDMGEHSYFAHENNYGMAPWDRLDQIDPPPYHTSGENIAAGQSDATAVMQGWMDSPGHRANILNDTFSYVGIGVYSAPGSTYGVYYVQLFAHFPADPAAYNGWYVAP